MSALTRIKIRFKSGETEELDVLELIEVNGQPFVPADVSEARFRDIEDRLAETETILRLITTPTEE